MLLTLSTFTREGNKNFSGGEGIFKEEGLKPDMGKSNRKWKNDPYKRVRYKSQENDCFDIFIVNILNTLKKGKTIKINYFMF